MSAADAEKLFWELFGVGGAAVGGLGRTGRQMNWQQYAKLVDAQGGERLTSGFEARALYRATLRELRGVEAETAASVRETARSQIQAHCDASCVEVIRNLVVDGRHSLDHLRRCLGTAVILSEAELAQRAQRDQQLQLSTVATAEGSCGGCGSCGWARFVETRLRPTLAAVEHQVASDRNSRADRMAVGLAELGR